MTKSKGIRFNYWLVGNKNPAKKQEVRLKISKANKGKKLSEESKKRIGYYTQKRIKEKGHPMQGKHLSEETRKKISKSLLGHPAPKSIIHKLNISKALFGKSKSMEHRKNWYASRKNGAGWFVDNEQKEKLSFVFSLEKNPNWKGGLSFEPYGIGWNEKLKKKILNRDNLACKRCNKTSQLSVHHIDYNKKNLNEMNLITLCISCNSKANFNRNIWKECYQELMGGVHKNFI